MRVPLWVLFLFIENILDKNYRNKNVIHFPFWSNIASCYNIFWGAGAICASLIAGHSQGHRLYMQIIVGFSSGRRGVMYETRIRYSKRGFQGWLWSKFTLMSLSTRDKKAIFVIWKQDHSSFSFSWSCYTARNLCGCFSNEIIHLLDKIFDSATFFPDRSSIHNLIWWYSCMQNSPNWTTLSAVNFDLKLDLDEFLYLKKNDLRLAQANLFMAKVLTYFVLAYPESISLSTLKSCNAFNWSGGAGHSLQCWFYNWLMLYNLCLCIVNVHWCRNSFGIRF